MDLIVPMTYALDTNRLQRITQPLAKEKMLGSALISPSVKLLTLPEVVAIDQIQALRDLPTGGYAIFAVESISSGMRDSLTALKGDRCNPLRGLRLRLLLRSRFLTDSLLRRSFEVYCSQAGMEFFVG